MTPQPLLVANPLPSALKHYTLELHETLERIGLASAELEAAATEGLRGPLGRVRMLSRALKNERRSRRQVLPVITTWPTLGLLDARVARPVRGARILVLHDPEPLRSQVGFDRLSKAWAERAHDGRRPTIMVHSPEAAVTAKRLLPRHEMVLTSHPMLSPRASALPPKYSGEVLVAGQFKPARDLDLLNSIGPRLVEMGYHPRIVGRGWPPVRGWEVTSRFVTETELDTELSRAQVVLLPYARYFQSGIAIRALELGTPTVGTRTGFLEGLYGSDYAGYAEDHSAQAYIDAIEAASAAPVDRIRKDVTRRVDESWSELLHRNGRWS